MKTIKNTGPLFYGAKTNSTDPTISSGKIRCFFVRYETIEYDLKDFDHGVFQVHDANSEEAKMIAALVNL